MEITFLLHSVLLEVYVCVGFMIVQLSIVSIQEGK